MLSHLTLPCLILFDLITPCLTAIFVTVMPSTHHQQVVTKLQHSLLHCNASVVEHVTSGGLMFCSEYTNVDIVNSSYNVGNNVVGGLFVHV